MSLQMIPTAFEGWTAMDLPSFTHLQTPIHVRSVFIQKHNGFPVHRHAFHQLSYAVSGCLLVAFNNSWYLTANEQAIWVPCGTQHSTGSFQDSILYTVYIRDVPDLHMPQHGTALLITPLMRSLIVELENSRLNAEDDAYISKINCLILEQLHRQPHDDFHLSWPESPNLQTICQELYIDPASSRSFEAWGEELGISPRTLMRRFVRELGMTPSEWRTRLRLFKAVDLLKTDGTITEIALKLGYATASAFTYMFHQKMGCTPSEWRRR